MKLDDKLYAKLCKECKKKESDNFGKWRRDVEVRLSYNTFIKTDIRSKDDLIKVAGVAYSWMPTMLRINEPENDKVWQEIIDSIENLSKNADYETRSELVTMLAKLVNNSIVGASKVLHFIKPNVAPIVDSNVSRGWNEFFNHNKSNPHSVILPSQWSIGNKQEHLPKKLNKYLEYWSTLEKWIENCREYTPSIREIEVRFYFLGLRHSNIK